MADRYWITGAQLGMIIAKNQLNYKDKEMKLFLEGIEENQFIGRFENPEDFQKFLGQVKEIKIKREWMLEQIDIELKKAQETYDRNEKAKRPVALALQAMILFKQCKNIINKGMEIELK